MEPEVVIHQDSTASTVESNVVNSDRGILDQVQDNIDPTEAIENVVHSIDSKWEDLRISSQDDGTTNKRYSNPCEIDEGDKNDEVITNLIRAIETRWEQEGDDLVGQHDREKCKNLMGKMLRGKEQLERNMVARKNKEDAAVDLFFEQLRFRARWNPKSITPTDIPNAFPCE